MSNAIYLHLCTVIPAFFIGTFLMFNHKGTGLHKSLGKIYMVLMFITAIITLFIPATVGPQIIGHFGFIHILSLLVISGVPISYVHAKNGRIADHRSIMMQNYIGGILIAGGFALFSPGRMLNLWLISILG